MVGTNAGVTVCCEIALSSHCFLPLPLCFCHSISLFYLLTLVFTIMSARELCSLQAGVTSPPKRGQKHGQSNSEAISTKCSQVTTKSEDEGSGEGEPAARKSTKKGKAGGKKGKRARCVAHPPDDPLDRPWATSVTHCQLTISLANSRYIT